jgi:hypothetical protein
MTELTTIAFDIETTGFQADDELTVVGFDSAVSSRVFLHTGTAPQTGLADRLNDALQTPVQLSLHDSEQELLNELATFVISTLTQRQLPPAEAVGLSVDSRSADTYWSDATSVAFTVMIPDFRAY